MEQEPIQNQRGFLQNIKHKSLEFVSNKRNQVLALLAAFLASSAGALYLNERYLNSTQGNISQYNAFQETVTSTYDNFDYVTDQSPQDITNFVRKSLTLGNVFLTPNPQSGIKNRLGLENINSISEKANQYYQKYRKDKVDFKDALLASISLAIEQVAKIPLEKQTFVQIWKLAMQNPSWNSSQVNSVFKARFNDVGVKQIVPSHRRVIIKRN